MTLPVKYYTSTMQGAPQLTDAWGDLVALLDACLVNGFNSKSITLTSAAGIATATVAAGHLNQVDQVVLVAGAAQTEYNGEVRILTTDATHFTYAITGTPASPATGTITAAVAPLNFAIAFTGTNKRVYRSANVASNRPYLRVDNSLDPAYTTTYAKKGKVTMAEGMSDVDTFVGARAPFDPVLPTKNETGTASGATVVDGWYKWYYARTEYATVQDSSPPTAFNRSWVLVGDDRGFYLSIGTSRQGGRAVYCFTDFASFRAGDGYNTLLAATEAYTNASQGTIIADPSNYYSNDFANHMTLTANPLGKVCMRSHIQVGGQVRLALASLGTIAGTSVSGYNTGVPWPNGPDYSLVLHPVYLQEETTGNLRGKLPGMMWVHNNNPLQDLAVVNNVVGYTGRKFLLVDAAYSTTNAVYTARLAFDITGPWW